MVRKTKQLDGHARIAVSERNLSLQNLGVGNLFGIPSVDKRGNCGGNILRLPEQARADILRSCPSAKDHLGREDLEVRHCKVQLALLLRGVILPGREDGKFQMDSGHTQGFGFQPLIQRECLVEQRPRVRVFPLIEIEECERAQATLSRFRVTQQRCEERSCLLLLARFDQGKAIFATYVARGEIRGIELKCMGIGIEGLRKRPSVL